MRARVTAQTLLLWRATVGCVLRPNPPPSESMQHNSGVHAWSMEKSRPNALRAPPPAPF
jgi:hypothetical protein